MFALFFGAGELLLGVVPRAGGGQSCTVAVKDARDSGLWVGTRKLALAHLVPKL